MSKSGRNGQKADRSTATYTSHGVNKAAIAVLKHQLEAETESLTFNNEKPSN